MDAKDILGLPKTPVEKKSRPQKESHRKPDGISREVYALTGGVAPLMPSIDVTQLKRRPPVDEKVAWQWLPFTNSARKDDLKLYHWVRVVNGVPPTGDYSFAKYNKSVEILKYTDDEYENHLTDPVWTKEETDQLFALCERFDLRFVLIADRFPFPRAVEELKDRYYSVNRALLRARAQSPADVANHPLIKIAQYLPGRTDNEIKNYWRTRVQKQAKHLRCDVNSNLFKETMRNVWMPRLVERINAQSSPATCEPVESMITTDPGQQSISEPNPVEPGFVQFNPNHQQEFVPASEISATSSNSPAETLSDVQGGMVNGSGYNPVGQTGFGEFNDWGCVGGDNMWTDNEGFWFLQDHQFCHETASYPYN